MWVKYVGGLFLSLSLEIFLVLRYFVISSNILKFVHIILMSALNFTILKPYGN